MSCSSDAFRPRNCLWFGCADRGTDGGVGDSAQGLGGVVLVSVHVNLTNAVGAGFDGQGMDRGVCAQGAAGEPLAGGR